MHTYRTIDLDCNGRYFSLCTCGCASIDCSLETSTSIEREYMSRKSSESKSAIRVRMSEPRQTRNGEKISNNYVECVRVEQEDNGRKSSEPVIPPRSDVTGEPSDVSR